jgi:hypothetical protein
VRLSVLGVTSLDAFNLSASAAPELPSDLERLLEHVLLRSAPASVPPTARVRLDHSRGAGFGPADLSLTEFGELNAAFRQAVLSARTLDSRDFHEDAGAIVSAADGAELGKRADRAVAMLKGARDALDARIAAGAPIHSGTRSSTSSSSASPRRSRPRREGTTTRFLRRHARSRRRRTVALLRPTRSRPPSTRRLRRRTSA